MQPSDSRDEGQISRAAECLARLRRAGLADVVDEHDGQGVLALECPEEAEELADLGRRVFVRAPAVRPAIRR